MTVDPATDGAAKPVVRPAIARKFSAAVRRGAGWALRRKALCGAAALLLLALPFALTCALLPPAKEIAELGLRVAFFVRSDGLGQVELLDTRAPHPVVREDIPASLETLLLFQEDRRFWDHMGIPVRETARALWRRASTGSAEGGSGITQQYAKNLWFGRQPELFRKFLELVLALKLERALTKDQILAGYLNTAPWGKDTYGVEAAARRYFEKHARDLNLFESAVLVVSLRAPSRYNWQRNREVTAREAESLLDRAAGAGWLAPEQVEAALATGVRTGAAPPLQAEYRWAYDHARIQLGGILKGREGLFVAQTSLLPDVQARAEAAVRSNTGGLAQGVEVGLLTMTHSGAIVAMSGGRDYARQQFNHATQARRQSGSLFKLPLYLAALQQGMQPGSLILDAPYAGWPKNIDNFYRGAVSLELAFSESLNAAAINLAREVGLDHVSEAARSLGLDANPMEEHTILGTADASLLALTAAYATIANGGSAPEPHLLLHVRNGGGRRIWRHPKPRSRPIVEPPIAGAIDRLLQQTVAFGTARAAAVPGMALRGKTGTTDQDAWFVGYGAEYCTGVWVGTPDNQPLEIRGGELPSRIFRDLAAAVDTAPTHP